MDKGPQHHHYTHILCNLYKECIKSSMYAWTADME